LTDEINRNIQGNWSIQALQESARILNASHPNDLPCREKMLRRFISATAITEVDLNKLGTYIPEKFTDLEKMNCWGWKELDPKFMKIPRIAISNSKIAIYKALADEPYTESIPTFWRKLYEYDLFRIKKVMMRKRDLEEH